MPQPLSPIPATYCRVCGYCIHALPEPRCRECGTTFDLSDPKSYLRRPPRHIGRWLVRVGILLAVILLPLAGGWGSYYYGWRSEQSAISALQQRNYNITSTAIGPAWLRAFTPHPLAFIFERADSAGYNSADYPESLDEQSLKALPRLQYLRNLRARLSAASPPDSLASIAGIESLEELALEDGFVSDEALLSLARLPRLQKLRLFCLVSEECLRQLRERRPDVEVDDTLVWFLRGLVPTSHMPSPPSSATRP